MNYHIIIDLDGTEADKFKKLLNAIGSTGIVPQTEPAQPIPQQPIPQPIPQSVYDNPVPAPQQPPQSAYLQTAPAPQSAPQPQQAPPVAPVVIPDYTHEQLGRAAAAYIDKAAGNRDKVLTALHSVDNSQSITQLDTPSKRSAYANALRALGVNV